MATVNTEALQADLDVFEISEELGFILREPLVSFIVFSTFLIKTLFFLPYSNESRSERIASKSGVSLVVAILRIHLRC